MYTFLLHSVEVAYYKDGGEENNREREKSERK